MASEFVWYELLTPDANASERFYGDVVGWTVKPSTTPGMDYRHLTAPDGEGVGGILQLTDDMKKGGARPVWLGYISVSDVDAEIAAIEKDGGRTQMKPTDVPGAGRMAMVADPQGAAIYVMKPTPPPDRPDAKSTAFSRTAPARCAWNELATSDPKKAFAFYARHFGWTDGGSMPMGEAGDYQFINDEDGMIGAVQATTNNRPSMWTYYFRVANIDVAKKKIEAAGGTVMHGPQEVPGGDHIIIGTDPQGAMFAVVGARS
ncbi:MAG TPA: VOC family protein [Vicinamibacterales bacterium]|nr:VOC family protein [Vicinamibacterales bacterium]